VIGLPQRRHEAAPCLPRSNAITAPIGTPTRCAGPRTVTFISKRDSHTMRLAWLLIPLAVLGLAGCIDVHEHPAPRETVVTPPGAPPPAVVAPPGSTATVVTH